MTRWQNFLGLASHFRVFHAWPIDAYRLLPTSLLLTRGLLVRTNALTSKMEIITFLKSLRTFQNICFDQISWPEVLYNVQHRRREIGQDDITLSPSRRRVPNNSLASCTQHVWKWSRTFRSHAIIGTSSKNSTMRFGLL